MYGPYENDTSVNVSLSQRDFKLVTPAIGGVPALYSESVNKKIMYDNFCDKLGTHITRDYKEGE